jgi:peptide chain release factor 1
MNKEYRDLEKILVAKKEYELALAHLSEAKYILANETDAEMREMAKCNSMKLNQKFLKWKKILSCC